eukprot:9331496-Ditylum_brightwellii.AAC.1
MGFHSSDLHPFFIVPSTSQLHPPPHSPVRGREAMDSTFTSPRSGFEPGVSDFQDSTKHA